MTITEQKQLEMITGALGIANHDRHTPDLIKLLRFVEKARDETPAGEVSRWTAFDEVIAEIEHLRDL